MLVSRQLNTFSGLEDVRDEYVAYFDTEKGILHHVSSSHRNAITIREQNNGYLYVYVYKQSGELTGVRTHRIVCEFFHGKPTTERPQVNHKNHNRKDNHASNLEWASHAENTSLDPIWKANNHPDTKAATEARRRPVFITLDDKTTRYASCTEAAFSLGYRDRHSLATRIQPLLKGETYSMSFYFHKLDKTITVKLADHVCKE